MISKQPALVLFAAFGMVWGCASPPPAVHAPGASDQSVTIDGVRHVSGSEVIANPLSQPYYFGFGFALNTTSGSHHPTTHTMVVTQVAVGSPAATSGLAAGDVIVAIDGVALTDSNLFRNTVEGTAHMLRVRRGGSEIEMEITAAAPQRWPPVVEAVGRPRAHAFCTAVGISARQACVTIHRV
ncbi:hypothetical protein BH23GEM6_BH23GEM6_14070 [soil metagenome]